MLSHLHLVRKKKKKTKMNKLTQECVTKWSSQVVIESIAHHDLFVMCLYIVIKLITFPHEA